MELPTVLQFGSRIGSYLALVLFCLVFVILSIAIARIVARNARLHGGATWLFGSLVFGALTATLYYSSLSGFYEAEIRSDRLVLSYLSQTTVEIDLNQIASVRTAPAFKGTWRLYVANAQGGEYLSATARREVVETAALKLRLLFHRRRSHPNRRA
jgi:hypothetical protein